MEAVSSSATAASATAGAAGVPTWLDEACVISPAVLEIRDSPKLDYDHMTDREV